MDFVLARLIATQCDAYILLWHQESCEKYSFLHVVMFEFCITALVVVAPSLFAHGLC